MQNGLDDNLVVDADAARFLRPGGWLLLELGYNSLDPARDAGIELGRPLRHA